MPLFKKNQSRASWPDDAKPRGSAMDSASLSPAIGQLSLLAESLADPRRSAVAERASSTVARRQRWGLRRSSVSVIVEAANTAITGPNFRRRASDDGMTSEDAVPTSFIAGSSAGGQHEPSGSKLAIAGSYCVHCVSQSLAAAARAATQIARVPHGGSSSSPPLPGSLRSFDGSDGSETESDGDVSDDPGNPGVVSASSSSLSIDVVVEEEDDAGGEPQDTSSAATSSRVDSLASIPDAALSERGSATDLDSLDCGGSAQQPCSRNGLPTQGPSGGGKHLGQALWCARRHDEHVAAPRDEVAKRGAAPVRRSSEILVSHLSALGQAAGRGRGSEDSPWHAAALYGGNAGVPARAGDPNLHRRSSFDETVLSLFSAKYGVPDLAKQAVYHKSNGDSAGTLPLQSITKEEVSEMARRIDGACARIDWTENAEAAAHIWTEASSGETCYIYASSSDRECSRSSARRRCSACHITVHVLCIPILEQMHCPCKPTFREAGIRNYREEQCVRHHWSHRRRQDGKCNQCLKSFPQKFPFQKANKEIVAISCSWCKAAYHNKQTCFQYEQLLEEICPLGEHAALIVPPSWIIKIPRKLALRSSVKKVSKKCSRRKEQKGTRRRSASGNSAQFRDDYKPFIVKPIPSSSMRPLLVFINPRSGGSRGLRLLYKFHWLLNPRQVFDITDGGPKFALELFKKVPRLHILVCGGDGTVGWVLSAIDEVGFSCPPAVSILPLGTGNDLARTLNWGSGYTDEPLGKILAHIEEGQIVQLDRWEIQTEPLPLARISISSEDGRSGGGDSKEDGSDLVSHHLPVSVMNNYFSLGADAHVLMEFHSSREANPEKFNSRFRNKMFYAGAGSKDLLKRTWRDLVDHVTLECDGIDYTSRIQELKLHCLLFLNISNYCSGTMPWGSSGGGSSSSSSSSSSGNSGSSTSSSSGSSSSSNGSSSGYASTYGQPRHDDGLLEVIGFTTAQLVALQVGGHGERIAQCREAKLVTHKTIPVQVDGEPCRLQPSIISIRLRNQANMVAKAKKQSVLRLHMPDGSSRLRIQVSRIGINDYETYHYDKEKLKAVSIPLSLIVVESNADLDMVREQIDRLAKDMLSSSPSTGACSPHLKKPSCQPLSSKWCFLDSTTAERFFRIDRGQEHLHYITDISSEDLYILDPELESVSAADPVCGDAAVENDVNASMVTQAGPELLCAAGQAQADGVSAGIAACHDAASSPLSAARSQPSPLPFALPATPPRSPLVDAHVVGSAAAGLQEKILQDSSKRGDLKKFIEAHRGGASMLCLDKEGMSVLHNAARFGYKAIVEYILEHGPKEVIDMLDAEKGQTALHKAAWYQRRTICGMLVAAGSSLSIEDKQGNTPKMQAMRAEDMELAAYFESQERFIKLHQDDALVTAV